MALVRRVPPLVEWPVVKEMHRLRNEDAYKFGLFLEAMEKVLLHCDELEQAAEAVAEGDRIQKPRTWVVVLPANEIGIGRSFVCGRPLFDEFPTERARFQKSSGYVVEKTTRLGIMHASAGHIASSQSANDAEEKYGGSVWLPDDSADFLGAKQVGTSGLPGGLLDEAAALGCLQRAGVLSRHQNIAIGRQTSNASCLMVSNILGTLFE